MSWSFLGTVIPIEKKWLDYEPTTQSADNPTESLAYRITGLNVQTLDSDKFYALVRFKYGLEIYSRAFRLVPNAAPQIAQVEIPLAITIYPFSWIPQIQLVYRARPQRPQPAPWAVQIDEFVSASMPSISDLIIDGGLYDGA